MNTIQATNATSVQIFNSPQFGEIRTIEVQNHPYFIANDVASALGYAKPRNAVAQHVDKEDALKQGYPDKQGVIQDTIVINESGVYSLIFGSKLPQAKEFKRWVTSEVLPAIRKQGGYIATKQDDTPEEIMARALIVAQQTIDKHKQLLDAANQQNQQLQGENELLQSENHTLAPKAAYTDEVLQSTSTFTLTQVAHSLGLKSVHVLTDLLSKRGILYRQSGQWQPSAKVASKGYFSTRTAKFIRSDNSIGSSISTVVTEMGRAYLHTLLCS